VRPRHDQHPVDQPLGQVCCRSQSSIQGAPSRITFEVTVDRTDRTSSAVLEGRTDIGGPLSLPSNPPDDGVFQDARTVGALMSPSPPLAGRPKGARADSNLLSDRPAAKNSAVFVS